jgi:hypothetical protein
MTMGAQSLYYIKQQFRTVIFDTIFRTICVHQNQKQRQHLVPAKAFSVTFAWKLHIRNRRKKIILSLRYCTSASNEEMRSFIQFNAAFAASGLVSASLFVKPATCNTISYGYAVKII